MNNKFFVQEALRQSLVSEGKEGNCRNMAGGGQDSLISMLIHEIFGAEILKTNIKSGWHFYNRLNGERIDLSAFDNAGASNATLFEDIPTSPDETSNYFASEDYSTFFTRFIKAFEETVGLDKYRTEFDACR